MSLEPMSLSLIPETISAITAQFAVRMRVSEAALRKYFYYNLSLTDKELDFYKKNIRLADLLVKWANREISSTELLTQLEEQMKAEGFTFHF